MRRYFRSQGGLIDDVVISDCVKTSSRVIEAAYGDGIVVEFGSDFTLFTPKRARAIAEFLLKCADKFEAVNGPGEDNSGDLQEGDEDAEEDEDAV